MDFVRPDYFRLIYMERPDSFRMICVRPVLAKLLTALGLQI